MSKNQHDWNYTNKEHQKLLKNLMTGSAEMKGHSLQPFFGNVAVSGKVIGEKDIIWTGKAGQNKTKGRLTLGVGTGEEVEFQFADDQALTSGLVAIARMVDKEYVRDQGFDSPARVAKKAYIRNVEASESEDPCALLLLPLSGHVREEYDLSDMSNPVKKNNIVVDELLQMRFSSKEAAEKAKTALIMLFSQMKDDEVKQVSAPYHVPHSHGDLAHMVQHTL